MKIENHNLAGKYQCQADNGIDEMQSKLIIVNVNGMFIFIVIIMNFALCNVF